MITFTKEQLIASAHARIEFAEMMLAGELEPLKERTWSIELELASIALASLEAEPVLYAAEETLVYSKHGELHLTCLSEPMGDAVIPLYTAPPAPVSVTDELAKRIPEILRTGKANRWEIQALAKGCRAAMLQGVEPVTTAYKLPFEQWLSQQTGTIDVECGCVMTEVFFHWLRVAYEAGNSPVTPGGWVMVPIEPTEHMIVEGFESEPDEFFSDEEVWEAYDAMSGCQQAAHRAKLCWAAMIEAAPKLE
ncbi:TPA: hypothetical protein ACX3LN_000599 [Enterobacter hormaechei]